MITWKRLQCYRPSRMLWSFFLTSIYLRFHYPQNKCLSKSLIQGRGWPLTEGGTVATIPLSTALCIPHPQPKQGSFSKPLIKDGQALNPHLVLTYLNVSYMPVIMHQRHSDHFKSCRHLISILSLQEVWHVRVKCLFLHNYLTLIN